MGMDESERLITAKLLTWSKGRKVSFPDSDFLLIYDISAKDGVFGSQFLVEPAHHVIGRVERPSQGDPIIGGAEGGQVTKVWQRIKSLLYFFRYRIYCRGRNSAVCIDLAS